MASATAMEMAFHGTESWEFLALVQKMSSLSKWVSSYAYNNTFVYDVSTFIAESRRPSVQPTLAKMLRPPGLSLTRVLTLAQLCSRVKSLKDLVLQDQPGRVPLVLQAHSNSRDHSLRSLHLSRSTGVSPVQPSL